MTGPLTSERCAEIRDIAARYRHRPYVGLASMAKGIDELADEVGRLQGRLKTVWASIYSDGEYATKDEALTAATADRFGTSAVEEDVCWRVVGDWHGATEDAADA